MESGKNLSWEEARNFNNNDDKHRLTNKKLWNFIERLKQQEGSPEYHNQILGVILID